jgi:hypothetical protein
MQALERYLRAQQNRRSQPAFLLEHCSQQVLHVHLLVTVSDCRCLRLPDRLLRFFRQPIEIHNDSLALVGGYHMSGKECNNLSAMR